MSSLEKNEGLHHTGYSLLQCCLASPNELSLPASPEKILELNLIKSYLFIFL